MFTWEEFKAIDPYRAAKFVDWVLAQGVALPDCWDFCTTLCHAFPLPQLEQEDSAVYHNEQWMWWAEVPGDG